MTWWWWTVASIDWSSPEVQHRLTVELVNATDHNSVLCPVELESSGNKISEGYYEDTRISASLSVIDWSAFDGYAWLRLTHSVDGTSYSETMLTGFVWDEGATVSRGVLTASPYVMSALKALANDYTTGALSVGQGGTAKSVASSVCRAAGRPIRFTGACPDFRFSDTRVWDAGTKRLDVLNDLADLMGARIDVDVWGSVVFDRYAAPSTREASMWLDAETPSVVLSSDMKRSSDVHQTAGRAIVTWSGSEGDGDARHDVNVSGFADVSSRSVFSATRRGYQLSDVTQLNDMAEPHNASHAQQLARTCLPDETSGNEWDVELLWVPIHEGDVVMFRPSGMEWRKCLAKSLDIDLNKWTISATLKEVG